MHLFQQAGTPAYPDNAAYPDGLLQAYTHCVVLLAIAEDDELSVFDGLDSFCVEGSVGDSRGGRNIRDFDSA